MTAVLQSAWLIAAATGVCFAVGVWCVCMHLAETPAGGAPLADHPSIPMRLLGRLISMASHHCAPWLSPRRRRTIERRVAQAGLRHMLDAGHFHGGQCLAAFGLSAVSAAGMAALVSSLSFVPLFVAVSAGGALGWLMPAMWLRDRTRERKRRVLRALPFMLDMTTLCVEAGLNLSAALQQAAQKGPAGPLRDELQRLQGDLRTGMSRAQALRDMADRLDEPAVRTLVGTLVQADALGMNLAPILRAQSDQRRNERFLHAEKLAMEAPVKMLLPLIMFIFPCTFIVIAFPIAVKLLDFSW